MKQKIHTRGGRILRFVFMFGVFFALTLPSFSQTYAPYQYDTIWSGEIFIWRGHRYSIAGTYVDTLLSKKGADSMYFTLCLAVVSTYKETIRYTQCPTENTFVLSNGVVVNVPDYGSVMANDTFRCSKSRYCPDTIRTYLISYGTTFRREQDVTLCVNDTFYWYGEKYFYVEGSGNYDIDVKATRPHDPTKAGCDTTYITHIHWIRQQPPTYDTSYICPGETIFFNNRIITEPARYSKLIRSNIPGQCDRIQYLDVFFNKIDTVRDTVYLCKGDAYSYNGIKIYPQKKDSTYTFYYKNSVGCDSLYLLHIHQRNTYEYRRTETICQGDTFFFDDEPLRESGFYTHVLLSAEGCDSTVNLHLIVTPKSFIDSTIYVCEGEPIIFKDMNGIHYLDEPNKEYQFVYQGFKGCDSILYLYVKEVKRYFKEDTVKICGDEVYNFRGRELWKTGNYYDTLKTKYSCDSIIGLRLLVSSVTYDTIRGYVCGDDSFAIHAYYHVRPPAVVNTIITTKSGMLCDSVYRTFVIREGRENEIITQQTICKGENYTWREHIINTAGTYSDTIHIENECDSIYTLIVKMDSTKITVIDTTICPTDYIRFRNTNISEEGVHYDTFPTIYCDSVVALHIHHFLQHNDTIYDTICSNQNYVFGNRLINQAGTYTDHFSSTDGCDSLITLCLHVYPTKFREYADTSCFGIPYTKLGNYQLTQSGDYSYTTPSLETNCDSTTLLHLLVQNKIETSEYIYLCEQDNFIWVDTLIETPGVYVKKFESRCYNGCDSTHTKIVNKLIPLHIFDTIYMCSNDKYIFHGQLLNKDSDYIDTTYSLRGCDSVFHHLKLIVYPYKETHVNATVCADDNTYITPAGHLFPLPENINVFVFRDTFHLEHKRQWCDSVVTYQINRSRSILNDTTVYICDNQTYTWRGRVLSQPGDYKEEKQTSQGCDSIFILHLLQKPTKDTLINVSICPSDSVYFKQKWHHKDTTVVDTFTTSDLCDSVVTLIVHVYNDFFSEKSETICEGETYLFNGRRVSQTKTYYDSLYTTHGCDSIYVLHLYVSPIINKYFRDTIRQGQECTRLTDTILKTTGVYVQTKKSLQYNCDSITTVHLFVAPDVHEHKYITICDNQTYTLKDNILGDTTFSAYDSTYQRHYTTKYKSDSTLFIHISAAKSFYEIKYDTIKNGAFYYFNKSWLAFPDKYYDSTRTSQGCDSVIELHLVVNKPQKTDTSLLTSCDGNPVQVTLLNGATINITRDTMFNDTTYNADNLINHVRTFIVRSGGFYAFEEHISLCKSDVYKWRNKSIYGSDGSKTYTDIVTVPSSQQVCGDSTFTLVVHVDSVYSIERDTTVCPSDIFYLYGKRILAENDYSFHLTTTANCDCTIVWHVHYYEEPITTIDKTICQGDYLFFGKEYLNQSGTYYDTLLTSYGCDSVAILNLTVEPVYHDNNIFVLCPPNSSYEVRSGLILTIPANSGKLEYHDTLPTIANCDSIHSYFIYQHPTYFISKTEKICSNVVYKWRGQECTVPKTYYDSIESTAVSNCFDTIYELILEHNQTKDTLIDTTICKGDWIYWGDEKIFEEKTYTKVFPSVINGCDSIVTMNVHYHDTFHININKSICEGDIYKFGSSSLYLPGDYYLFLHTINGCDSIVHLNLSVISLFETINVPLCGNKTYSLPPGSSQPGKLIFDPNNKSDYIYTDTLNTPSGCAKLVTYICDVQNSYFHAEYKSTCDNDPITWRGKQYDKSDIYYDSLETTTSEKCDSVFMLDLRLDYHIEKTIDTFICPSDFIILGQQIITEEGEYTETFSSSLSCDSTITMHVHWYKDTIIETWDTICQGEHVWFVNTYISEPGNYVMPLVTSHGCDSIYILHLVRHNTFYKDTNIVTCPKYPLIINTSKGPVELKSPYIYNDSLKTIHGCDSIIKYIVTIDPSYLLSETITVCKGQDYFWRGQHLTLPGTYRDTFQTQEFECDSIYEIVFENYETFYNIIVDTIKCTNKPYLWRGRLLSDPGYYVDSMSTAFGCDSIFELFLEVCHSYLFKSRDTICDAFPVNFRGRKLNKTGIYYDSLKISKKECGCDSVYMLDLVAYNTPHYIVYDTICLGDSILLEQEYQKKSGTYYDSVFDPKNQICKTTQTHLFVFKPEHVQLSYLQINDFCADDDYIYIYSDNTYIRPKYYFLTFDEKTREKGFLNVYYGKYSNTIAIDVPQYDDNTYIRPDIYNVRLDLDYARCHFDTIYYDLAFTAHYPNTLLSQNRNGIKVNTVLSQTGGYKFDNYRWYVNEQEVFGANGNILSPGEYTIGDYVQVGIIRRGETQIVTSCPIQVQQLPYKINKISIEKEEYINVTPTLVPLTNCKIYISATENGTYQLYDQLGRCVQSGIFFNNQTTITLPKIAGCYILKVCTSQIDKMIKIIIE